MKRESIILIIGYAILLLFVYAALSKLFAYQVYLKDLERSPELSRFARPISIAIPGTELLSAALIIIPKWRKAGFWLATILMISFTLYVGYVLQFSDELPCTCGDIIRNLTWPQHMVFNIFFTLLAILGLRLSSKLHPPHESNKTAIA